MKRTLIVACLLGLLAGLTPASADRLYTGSVLAAVAHPAIPRALYLESQKLNGTAGYVVPIEASHEARPYMLRRVAGGTGRDDLDAWFYRDINGTGDPCPRHVTSQSDGNEAGMVCAGATFAVIVLFAGAETSFELAV